MSLLTLDQVVAEWGIGTDDHDRDVAARWLADQIRAGKITARRIRRRWWMTAEDRRHALDVFANRPSATSVPSYGISIASARNRRSA